MWTNINKLIYPGSSWDVRNKRSRFALSILFHAMIFPLSKKCHNFFSGWLLNVLVYIDNTFNGEVKKTMVCICLEAITKHCLSVGPTSKYVGPTLTQWFVFVEKRSEYNDTLGKPWVVKDSIVAAHLQRVGMALSHTSWTYLHQMKENQRNGRRE